MLKFPIPALLNGDKLTAEVTAVGYAEVGVLAVAEELEVRALTAGGNPIDGRSQDAIQAIIDAHDPEVVSADRMVIPADGVQEVLVRWRKRTATGAVQATVNGLAVQVPIVDAAAELAITAAEPGPVEVLFGSIRFTLEAR